MNRINQFGVFFPKAQHNNPANTCQSPFVSVAESNSNPCLHWEMADRQEEIEIKINTITSCFKLLNFLRNTLCKNTQSTLNFKRILGHS